MALLTLSPVMSFLVAASAMAQAPETQRISLQDAIQTALKHNLQVQIATETRESARAGVTSELGAFDWTMNTKLTLGKTDSAFKSPAFPGGPIIDIERSSSARELSLGSSKLFQWGGNLQLNYTPSYTATDQKVGPKPAENVSPSPYIGTLGGTYTQPLLRGFGRNIPDNRLIIARKGAQIADYTFQKAVIDLVANTESLYWDLVFAERNLGNKRQALNLAQKQLNENKIRVEVGTMAPIEVTSAEASVAAKEQEIIAAEATVLNARDALVRALYPTGEKPADLMPADLPNVSPMTLDASEAEKRAMAQRVEIKSAKLDLESKQLQEQASENRLKPQLDVFASYVTTSGSQPSYAKVQSEVAGLNNPGYTVGLSFSMPIGNRAAKGGVVQTRATRRSSEYTLKDTEQGVLLEVRQSHRNLAASEKGVRAAEKTRIFREKDLDAEQKKFENGMSTNFFVLTKQNDLDAAKSVELQAQITYAKAVTQLYKSMGTLLEARKLEVK